MPRFRLIIAACLATFAVGAVVSTTALAGEWDVNGKPLVGSVALANKILVLEHGFLEVPAAGLKIECFSHEVGITEGKLVAKDGVEVASLSFKSCETNTPVCTIGSETINTVPLDGLASLEGTLNTLILVLPKTKNSFATIKFNGATCSLAGVQPVTGHAHILIHEGFDPAVVHRGLALGKLNVGNDEATLSGLVGDVELAEKQTWNFL